MAGRTKRSNSRMKGLYMKDPYVWTWAAKYAESRGDSLSGLVEGLLKTLRAQENHITLPDAEYDNVSAAK